MGPQTQAIHAGEPNRHGVGVGVGPSISRTSTFTFSSTEEMKRWAEGKSSAYIYTRYGNPTHTAVESAIAELEGADAALLFASGMNAITTSILALVKSGDHIVAQRDIYGGVTKFLST